jgi:hypothetical protein
MCFVFYLEQGQERTVYSELSSSLFVQAILNTKLTTIIVVRLNTRLPTSQLLTQTVPLNSHNSTPQTQLLHSTATFNGLYSTATTQLTNSTRLPLLDS